MPGLARLVAMALHLRPVGPLPPAVYWRRRAGVLGLVLLLLVLLSRCAGEEEPALSQAAPAAGPTPTAAATGSSTPAATPGPPAPCPDSVLRVSSTPDRAAYPRGARPVLRLGVRNSGPVPCTRALGSGAVELLVFSGRDRVWSSDDCNPGGEQGEVLLQPQELRSITVTWSGRRSRGGCPAGAAVVEPGTYRVVGRVGEVLTLGTYFRMR